MPNGTAATHAHCNDPVVHISGKLDVDAVEVVEKVSYTKQESLLSHSHGALQTFSQIDSKSDASDYSDSRQFVIKPVNRIILNLRYEIKHEVIGGCAPFRVVLKCTNEIDTEIRCLPTSGVNVFTISKIFNGDTYPGHDIKALDVTITAKDFNQKKASCAISIPGA